MLEVFWNCTANWDNSSRINISKNHLLHSRTKHDDTMHHLIKELVENGTIELMHVSTKNQLVDLFTKSLDAVRFKKTKEFSQDVITLTWHLRKSTKIQIPSFILPFIIFGNFLFLFLFLEGYFCTKIFTFLTFREKLAKFLGT